MICVHKRCGRQPYKLKESVKLAKVLSETDPTWIFTFDCLEEKITSAYNITCINDNLQLQVVSLYQGLLA